MADIAPHRIWIYELCDLLKWYEENLCAAGLRDPLGRFVRFTPERFPHFIKLRGINNKPVQKPQKQVEAIKTKQKGNKDFGGFDLERAQTLSWIPVTIGNPSRILELTSQPIIGPEKAGGILYVKEFEGTKRRYRFQIVVCRTVGKALLVPITCHPRDHGRYPSNYKQIWP